MNRLIYIVSYGIKLKETDNDMMTVARAFCTLEKAMSYISSMSDISENEVISCWKFGRGEVEKGVERYLIEELVLEES